MNKIIYAVFRNAPIYMIVFVLAATALPKQFWSQTVESSPQAVGANQSTTNSQLATANQPIQKNRQNQIPTTNNDKRPTENEASSKGLFDIARLTIDSTKDKYDSLKDLYEKLFSVIAALGALFAFLGFKGADSFIQAKQKAEETLKKAEDAQEQINKFLTEIYPKNNKAEVNVTTGIVLRHIADAYKTIISKTQPNHDFINDNDYKNFLKSALYYLDSVDEATGIDDALRNRTATTKGNVFRRLEEYERAISVLEQRIKAGIGDDDSIVFNLACYYTLKAQREANDGNSIKAAEAENLALEHLSNAIAMEPKNRTGAAADADFEYFVKKNDQRFNALIQIKEELPCPLKGSPNCPAGLAAQA